MLNHLSAESEITVLDATGKKLYSTHTSSPEVLLPLSQKGLYLLQVQQNQTLSSYKVIRWLDYFLIPYKTIL